jgi:predicted phage tail protein
MKDLHTAVWKWPLLLLTTTTVPEYQDGGFDFGKTYLYVVRSVVNAGGGQLESGDSRPAIVTPKDTFPPAAPQDVVAAVLPGATAGTSVVDLSWAINIETDLAGYRVYRSEREDERGQLLTPDLLPTPAYRESTVALSHRYWYKVAAVDRAGNESPPSTPVLVEVP